MTFAPIYSLDEPMLVAEKQSEDFSWQISQKIA